MSNDQMINHLLGKVAELERKNKALMALVPELYRVLPPELQGTVYKKASNKLCPINVTTEEAKDDEKLLATLRDITS